MKLHPKQNKKFTRIIESAFECECGCTELMYNDKDKKCLTRGNVIIQRGSFCHYTYDAYIKTFDKYESQNDKTYFCRQCRRQWDYLSEACKDGFINPIQTNTTRYFALDNEEVRSIESGLARIIDLIGVVNLTGVSGTPEQLFAKFKDKLAGKITENDFCAILVRSLWIKSDVMLKTKNKFSQPIISFDLEKYLPKL